MMQLSFIYITLKLKVVDYITSFPCTHVVFLIFPLADLQSTIHFLKTQSGNRDQQLRIIREETSKLDKRVDQLSKSINRVQKTTYPLYRNAGAETTGLNIPNSNEGPKSKTLEQTTSLIDVSDTLRSEPPKKLKFHFSTNSAEVKRERKSESLPRQPLTRNEIGLKCRSVCTDDDNRVKCLEGRDRELFKTPSKSSSLETDDKLNLPTRDEWKRKKLPRIREMDGTKPKLKLWFFFQEIFFIDIKVVLINLLLPLLTFDQCNLI